MHVSQNTYAQYTRTHTCVHTRTYNRRIQADFGGDLNLVDQHRSFIKEGKLVKISSSNGKRSEYHFFLFSDILMYASEAMQTKYKMHKVLHLSLCRLQDITSDARKWIHICTQTYVCVCVDVCVPFCVCSGLRICFS